MRDDIPTSLEIYNFHESLQCPVLKRNFITGISIRCNINKNFIENCFQKLDFPVGVRAVAECVMKEFKLKLSEKEIENEQV